MNEENPPGVAFIREYTVPRADTQRHEAMFVCLFVLALSFVFLADKIRVPNQLLAMIYGAIIGYCYAFVPYMKTEQERFWGPDTILVLCHPIMIIKVAYTLDIYVFVKSIWQVVIVSTLGTGIFTLMFGFLIIVMTGNTVNLVNIVAAGTTLAAIDVPEVLMELNKIKNLEVIMDGESIFGTALCITTFAFCQGYYDGQISEWYHVVCLYIRFILGAVIVGVGFGKMIAIMFRSFYHDSFNAITALLCSSYAVYFLSENVIFCSGTICTFMLGFTIAKERWRLSPAVDLKVQVVLDTAYNSVELLNCIVLSAFVTFRMIQIYKGFDLAVAVGVYIIGNVLRILILLLLSPILSRLGLGFNFTTLFTIFWAAKRGSMQLLQVIYIAYYDLTKVLGTELLCFTLVYLILSFLINMTSLGFILKYFGLIEFTMARKYNISECINILLERKQRVMFTLKANRGFADLNWILLDRATNLDNPYASTDTDLQEKSSHDFKTVCPICTKSIPYASSVEELQELLKESKRKVLKRQRISLVRQFEMGLLSRIELETILQYVEVALTSSDLKLRLSYFIDLFKTDDFLKNWKNKLEKYKLDNIPIELRKSSLFPIFTAVRSLWFLYLKIIIISLNTVLIIAWLICDSLGWPYAIHILWIGYTLVIFFIMDMVLKLLAFTDRTLRILYLKHYWKIFEAFLLLLDILSFIASVWFNFHHLRGICIIRIIFLGKLMMSAIPQVIKYLDSKMDRNLYFAYTFGLALVYSLEDVQGNIHTICKYPYVRKIIAGQIEQSKLTLVEQLANVQSKRPWVAITLTTCQIKIALLKAMASATFESFSEGVIEEYEYRKLRKPIEKSIKSTNPFNVVNPNSVKTMLREIPWMGNDEEMFNYISNNFTMRIWEPGAVICNNGQFIDGVYLVINGLLKMTYTPNSEVLKNLQVRGNLPIKEVMSNTHFDEAQEEYLFGGNTLGELSFLTKRPYCCKIEVVTSSCGLVISNVILAKAAQFNTDPVCGLICRMWKYVSGLILWQMLLEKSNYQNVAGYALQLLINRAFVPNISHYKVFNVSNYIQDIFVLDGVVTDNTTKQVYTAPCYLPRSLQQLNIAKKSGRRLINTKIIIIPRISIDLYTIMETSELISELVKEPSESALIKNVFYRKEKREAAIAANFTHVEEPKILAKFSNKMKRDRTASVPLHASDKRTNAHLEYVKSGIRVSKSKPKPKEPRSSDGTDRSSSGKYGMTNEV